MSIQNKLLFITLTFAVFACESTSSEFQLEETSQAAAVARKIKPKVLIVSPLNGTSLLEGANRAGIQVELTDLDATKEYRVIVNGVGEGGLSPTLAPIITGVTEYVTTITVDALPTDGRTAGPLSLPAGYPYPTWTNDTPRLFRGFQAELLELDDAELALGATKLLDRDRVVLYDLRAYGESPNTPSFVATDTGVERTLQTRLTESGFLHLEPELMTLFQTVSPIDESIPELITTEDVSTKQCERLPSLTRGIRTGLRLFLTPYKTAIDNARTALGYAASSLSDYKLCVDLGEADIEDLKIGTISGLEPSIVDRSLNFVAAFPGALEVVTTINLDRITINYAPELSIAGVAVPPVPLPRDGYACDAEISVTAPVFDASYDLEPRVSDTERTRASQISASVFSLVMISPSNVCAESFLASEMLGVNTEITRVVQEELLNAWNDFAPEHRLVQVLEAIGTSFDTGPRGSDTPINTIARHSNIGIVAADPLATPDAPGLAVSGITWTSGTMLESTVLSAGAQPSTFFHMQGRFAPIAGQWVPEHIDPLQREFDMSVAVNMPLLNQALAAAVPTERFSRDAELSYGILGLDCGPSYGIDCDAPAPLTGTTLGAIFPSVAALKEINLKIELRPTLSPVITMENNAILDDVDADARPDPTRLYLHIPQYTVTIRQAEGREPIVVQFTVDLFDRDFQLDLGELDGQLDAVTHLGECDVVPVVWGTVQPSPEEAVWVRSLFVEEVVLPAVQDTIKDIAVPELATVPGFAGPLYGLNQVGKLPVNDVLTFYLAFE